MVKKKMKRKKVKRKVKRKTKRQYGSGNKLLDNLIILLKGDLPKRKGNKVLGDKWFNKELQQNIDRY